MTFTGIVAMTRKRVIGFEGRMPWHLPEDLAFFKKTTAHHSVLMGRKTWESLHVQPLPRRQNIVLTRQPTWTAKGAIPITHLSELQKIETSQEIFVIGGGSVYQSLLNDMDKLYISYVKGEYLGDTFFPDIEGLFPYSRQVLDAGDFEVVLYGKDALSA